MDEMSVEKWWNEICGRGKREKPRDANSGPPAVGGERLTACATRPLSLDIMYYIVLGRRVIGISGFMIWYKTLLELIFNPFGEFR